jgi:TnpA family transposase
VHPQSASELLGRRGRGDARRPAAPLHRRRIEANYTDTHRASVVGFAFCHLLGFRLLPRLKNIGAATLYGPSDGATYPGLDPILNRPIRWGLISQQYDQLIKYVTALRLGNRRIRAGASPLHPRRA